MLVEVFFSGGQVLTGVGVVFELMGYFLVTCIDGGVVVVLYFYSSSIMNNGLFSYGRYSRGWSCLV